MVGKPKLHVNGITSISPSGKEVKTSQLTE
uniref:Uncharacterized protein n=1 Tax=Rhizophora mucronata TaxID=61149 RepID=A0A2P2QML1_RHIMU